jgi:YD repeat-containing protein
MAIGSGATPGILQPGDSGRIRVVYRGLLIPVGSARVTFSLKTLTADDVSWSHTETTSSVIEDPPGSGNRKIVTTSVTTGEDWHIDWSDPTLRPEFIPADAWNAVVANLSTLVGTEWGNYDEALANDANFLHTIGQDTNDVSKLWNFEVAQAAAQLSPLRFLAASVDASVPSPGLPLTFGRVYGQSIISRYKLGPLGRGWTTNWDIRAEVQSNSDVVLRGPGGNDRLFSLDPLTGKYVASPGDFGRLELVAGEFRLTETDGTLWQFGGDGNLDFVQDTNANRVMLGYSGGKLTSLTHSSGQQLLLDYNAAGRLRHLTETAGPGPADDRVTTYEYDASGEHLMRVIAPGNYVTTYDYDTSGIPQRMHALTSVEYADGTHDFFG